MKETEVDLFIFIFQSDEFFSCVVRTVKVNTLSRFQVYKTVLLTSTELTHLTASWYPLASISPFFLPAPNPVPGYQLSTLCFGKTYFSQIPHVSDAMQYLFLYLLYFT